MISPFAIGDSNMRFLPRSIFLLCGFIVASFNHGLQIRAQAQPASEDSQASGHRVETNRPTRLPEVVVTATQTEEDPFTLPYAVDLVPRADLERKLSRTTPEALRELPSVMLQKTGHGQGSPYLRGFTGFRTLMLVDGIRLNNSIFRDGPNQYWNTVDSLTLDRMEVVRGPSSVLYGSDAIGGTVNALTKTRTEFGDGFNWDRELFYRFSSAEDSHIGRAEISGNFGHELGFVIGGSVKEFGDLRGGEDVGRQPKTGYSERDWDGKFEYFITPNSRFVLGHQTVDQDDAWRTHSTIYGLLWSGTTRGNDLERILDQNRDLTYLQYHAEELTGFVQEIHASVSHHLQEEGERRLRNDLRRELQGFDVHTLGVSLQLQSPSPVGRWIYGAEYYRDWVDSFFRRYAADGTLQVERRQGPVADNASYDLGGVYVENQLPLFDEHLELILGGRYTYAAAEARKVEDSAGQPLSLSDSWNTVVGSGRALYHFDEARHWNVFAGASQGFRAPNLSDLTRFDIALSGEQEIPAFGLEPERFVTYEIGARTSYERFAAQAGYFYTMIDDMIVRVPTGATAPTGEAIVNKENSGEGYVHGVELSGSVKPHQDWELWANFTWMEGSVETPLVAGGALETEPISRLMPITVNVGLRWEHPSRKFWGEFASTLTAIQDRLSSSDERDTQRIPVGGTPGYDVYHLRAGWKPTKNFTLSAALENLADADYRIHGSGLNEPGRNFIVSANLRF
jgi:hemoglobin/transferrin/lactoferrin receptor protein